MNAGSLFCRLVDGAVSHGVRIGGEQRIGERSHQAQALVGIHGVGNCFGLYVVAEDFLCVGGSICICSSLLQGYTALSSCICCGGALLLGAAFVGCRSGSRRLSAGRSRAAVAAAASQQTKAQAERQNHCKNFLQNTHHSFLNLYHPDDPGKYTDIFPSQKHHKLLLDDK